MRERFLEESFLLQYHLKMSYSDIRSLPLPYRRWYLERIATEFQRQADARKKSSDQSKNMQDIPMGEMYERMGLDPSQSLQPSPAPAQQNSPPARGRTLKFNNQ